MMDETKQTATAAVAADGSDGDPSALEVALMETTQHLL